MEKEATQKDAEILVADFMERAKFAKSEICAEKDIENKDNPAILIVVFEPKEEGYEGDYNALKEMCDEMGLSRVLQCAMVPLIHKPDVADCLTDVIGAFPLDKCAYLFLACEGFVGKQDDGKLPDDYQRGDLEKDYKENPFSQVTEAIVIHGYDWNLTNRFMSVCHYGYDDNGLPKYGEEINSNDEPNEDSPRGRIDELLYRGIQFLQMNNEATRLLSKWQKKGGR